MPSLKSIEPLAQVAEPAARELAAATAAKLGEWVGAVPASEEMWQLPRRRFLRRDHSSSALDALPTDIDWQARKLELSEAIARRITQPRLTEQEFFQPVRSFEKSDQPLVRGILELSAGNVTDLGLMLSVGSISAKLEELFPRRLGFLEAYAASPSSPGNMLAYLWRKSLESGHTTHHFDYEALDVPDGVAPNAVVIFDDLRQLNDSTRAALMKLQATRSVVAVDIGGFERAVNFIDFANGPEAVRAKLDGLLFETKQLLKREPSLAPELAAKRSIEGSFDEAVAAFNRESPWSDQPVRVVRSEPVSVPAAFEPVVTPGQVSAFLEERLAKSSAARITAAEVLAEDTEFHTLAGLIPKMRDLQEALRVTAQRHNIDPEKDIFVVAAEDSGHASSDAFMTYLYKQATGLASDRIVTLKQLQALEKDGKLEGRRVVALDDAIYNGQQVKLRLSRELAPYSHVAFTALSAFDRFARRWDEGALAFKGVRELVTLQTDIGFGLAPDGRAHSLIGSLSLDDRRALGLFNLVNPVGSVASLKVFPHMSSDTSPPWLSQFVGRLPLTFGYMDKFNTYF